MPISVKHDFWSEIVRPKELQFQGFPDGSFVKNPLADAGDTSQISWSEKIPHAAGKLNL